MLREMAKRTHWLLDRAHRAKISNGEDTPQETAKVTHMLSKRAHQAKVSN